MRDVVIGLFINRYDFEYRFKVASIHLELPNFNGAGTNFCCDLKLFPS